MLINRNTHFVVLHDIRLDMVAPFHLKLDLRLCVQEDLVSDDGLDSP